jgi:hypothetical protein
VCGYAFAERNQIIATLERRYDTASGMAISYLEELFGYPHIIGFLQYQLGKGISSVRVKAGRDQHQLRAEGVERRQDPLAHTATKLARPGHWTKRHIDDIPDTGLTRGTGAGIERVLVRGGIEQPIIGLERGLGAVAVVDIKVDHGDASEPVCPPCMQGADGYVVEQAEAHRLFGFGMMTGRTHGAKSIVRLPCEDRIDRRDHSPGGAQSSLSRTRRDDRVGVDRHMSRFRNSAQNSLDMSARMDAPKVFGCCLRRLTALQPSKLRSA